MARDGLAARRPGDRLGDQGPDDGVSEPSPQDNPRHQRLRRALRGAALFSDLDAGTLAAVERAMAPIVLQGGEALFRAGDPSDAIYVVASGCLGVFRKDPDNPELVLVA